MNTLQRNLLRIFALTLLLVATSAKAVLLSDLYAGGSITAGGTLQFDQFQFLYQDQSLGIAAPDPSQIQVTALDDGGTNPGPGLAFDAGTQFTVNGDGTYAYSDYSFGFRVSTLNGQLIEDNLLRLGNSSLVYTANGTQDLGMAIVEKVFDALGNQLAEKYVEFSSLGTNNPSETRIFEDHAAWGPGLGEVFVEKNILVWSANPGDIAQLVSFEQRFSTSIPEPSTLLLFSLGFAGLGFTRKGRRA